MKYNYETFHNLFYHDEIRADQKCGTEIGVGIHYQFIINHILSSYCQENPQKSTERDM